MNTFSIHRLLGVALISLLAACTSVPAPTPTPVVPIANATIVVERETAVPPTASRTPTLVPTRSATTTTPTATVPPTQTPSPTPLPTPTPDPNLYPIAANLEAVQLSNVIVSSQGQLAYIQGGALYVETQPYAGDFLELGRYAQTAAWSPDGSQLVYSLSNSADQWDPAAVHEQHLWSAVDHSDVSLSQLIANYPVPPYHVRVMHWSPDGTKILIESFLDERHEEANLRVDDAIQSAVDLEQQTLVDHRTTRNATAIWFTNEVYIMSYHCGSPCASYVAYDYMGQLVWSPDWATGGMVDFAPLGNFMISLARIDITPMDGTPPVPYPATVDEINLSSGEVRAYWERPREGEYFTPFIMPQISTDEQFISFHYGASYEPDRLIIIDRSGQEYGTIERSYALAWRPPNGGLALSQLLAEDQQRLLYFTLDGTTETVFTTTQGVEIASDTWLVYPRFIWSLDGRFFAFITHDNNKDTEQLYLWQPDNGELRLIYSTNQGQGIYNLAWLPNSQGFYFVASNKLWRYDVGLAAP
jgi:Tol biopolymer transport system component